MTDERFNQLINGPLSHPLAPLALLRYLGALRHVVEATGTEGEQALEQYCAARQAADDEPQEEP